MAQQEVSWLELLLADLNCTGYMFNSGQFSNVEGTVAADAWNTTLNYPAWYVRCSDSGEYAKLTGILTEEYATLLQNLPEAIEQITFQPQKNDFDNSNLVIAFMLLTVCVGSWMLFLLLFLLPSTNHNRQQKMVHFYVLYFSVVASVLLKKTTTDVFYGQYTANYQNSKEFKEIILRSAWYQVTKVISVIGCDINWIMVVYYMFSDTKKINSRWLPKWLNTNNHIIIFVSTLVSSLHAIFFGLFTFRKTKTTPLWIAIPLRTSQMCLFTLYFLAVVLYTYKSLNSTTSQTMDQEESTRRKASLQVLPQL